MLPLRNTPERFGLVAISMHWIIAIVIVGLLIVGLIMGELPMGPQKLQLYGLHKAFGAVVLFLAVLRVLWRAGNKPPVDPDDMPVLQKKLAHAAHHVLYLLMFAMPISGWLMSSSAGFPVSVFGIFTLPDLVAPDKEMKEVYEEIHETMAFLLMAVLAAHAGAALLHHFYYKDKILKRMLPFKFTLLLALCAPVDSFAKEINWNIVKEQSSLSFTATQNNSPVKGSFGEFSGTIVFDKEKPESSKIHIVVKMDSVSSSSSEVAEYLKMKEWFNVKEFPEAVFDSESVTANKNGNYGSYKANGKLTIRGVSLPIQIDFRFDEYDDAPKAVAKGTASLARTKFGVGQGEWAKADTIRDDVSIEFTVTATPAS